MPAWQAAGLPVDTDPPSELAAHGIANAARAAITKAPRGTPSYDAQLDGDAVCSLKDVQQISGGNVAAQLVDARSADRFNGQAPEPRADIPSGHMPGARIACFQAPIMLYFGNGKAVFTQSAHKQLQREKLSQAASATLACPCS